MGPEHCWLAGRAVDIEPVSVLILQNSGIFQIAVGDFRSTASWEVEFVTQRKMDEFKKRRIGGVLGGNSLGIWRDWTGWLAQQCKSPPALPVFPANREFYREFCKIAVSGAPETVKL
jgi:hypothetical protein